MSTWEERMSQRAAARAAAREAAERAGDPAFSPDPPDPDDHCSRCEKWEIENASIGRYCWWYVCDFMACTCQCHPEPPSQRVLIAWA